MADSEFATFVVADESPMVGFLGRMMLKCGAENADLSRVNSRSGMSFLVDHRGDRPIGKVIRQECRGGRIEGEARLSSTARSEPYLQELRSGIRDGISPGFLVFEADVVDDPDVAGEMMLVITKYEIYETSSTPIPRNANAGLLGITKRSSERSSASITPEEKAEIKRLADDGVATAMADLDNTVSRITERYQGEIKPRKDVGMAVKERVRASVGDGPKEDKHLEPEALIAALRLQLFGGSHLPDGVGHESGVFGKISTVKLAFDTTSTYGAVSEVGGAPIADSYYETSPRRILALPRRIENLRGDQQIPILATEPNSSMVAQGAARLGVTDATFDSTPPVMAPRRLQTVLDVSLMSVLVSPGFELLLSEIMLAASDRQMAQEILRGDGTGVNILGIKSVPGVLTHEYATTDKGSQAGFFDAEDALAVSVPSDRRAWVVAEDVYRKARRTVREPGSGDYVLRAWENQYRILDDAMAVRSNVLEAGFGIYGEWSAATLGVWMDQQWTVDRLTLPGVIKITLDRWFAFAVTRPANFVILSEE